MHNEYRDAAEEKDYDATQEDPDGASEILILLSRNSSKRNVPVRDVYIAYSWNYDGDIPQFDRALRWLGDKNWVELDYNENGQIYIVIGLTAEGMKLAADFIAGDW